MTVRVAAVGDLHIGVDGADDVGLDDVEERADLLLLAGDLTRGGDIEEAKVLADRLDHIAIPVVAVLGNHDHHAGRVPELVDVLGASGVQVLEGDVTTIHLGHTTVGIAGAKGFGGGFAGACATEFGEPEMKAFAGHTRETAEQLGRALEALDTDLTIALLHYSPIPETLVGEPLQIHPFLGSYLLAEAIDLACPHLAIHGHAHRGSERGRTPGGVRVRNVARPVIAERYRVFHLHPESTRDAACAAGA
ncbi:MAG TPA: metallophosphoesterase [Microthrixaceae bacterium]|nr:metallophosphoesterase [Microthrixaceae bacterium]